MAILIILFAGLAATTTFLPPRKVDIVAISPVSPISPVISAPEPPPPPPLPADEPSSPPSEPAPSSPEARRPVAEPSPKPQSPTILPPPPPTEILPTELPINLRTVVILRCNFVNAAGQKKRAFGSGAIISAQGHILTARHVFDLDFAYEITGGSQGLRGYQLTNCEVGQPPPGTTTPTSAQIRAINPFITVSILPYVAEKFFVVENYSGWSPAEKSFLDLGLLKISGTSADAQYFGYSLPSQFELSPTLADEAPKDNQEIITFGFPSGNPEYGGQFYLQGSVGRTTALLTGDQKFQHQVLGIEAQMETIAGRSGSPVFWRGYVIGVVSSKEDHSINSTSISVMPLMRILREAGININL